MSLGPVTGRIPVEFDREALVTIEALLPPDPVSIITVRRGDEVTRYRIRDIRPDGRCRWELQLEKIDEAR